jgi:hypothetical protein
MGKWRCRDNGAEWITTTLSFVAAEMHRQGERPTPHVHAKTVHASRGKQTRAEPVSAEFEHGRCHLAGIFPHLEAEMTGWVPGMPSPSRMDALVWCMTELLLGAHVPRDLTLAAALDLHQPGLEARAMHGRPAPRGSGAPVDPDVMDLVRRRWSVDPHAEEDW